MALQFHSPVPLTDQPYRHHPNLRFQISSRKLKFTVRSQNPSTESANEPAPPPKKPAPAPAAGQGFGSPSPPAKSAGSGVGGGKKKQKGRREREDIIRRSPVGKQAFIGEKVEGEADEQQGANERAFVLTWLGLGGVILVQGIVLSASGFLPEEWDRFFVKYLFPTFTPTVGLFLAGTVAYGVLKYLQNEKLKDKK
ncbi:Protein LPA2 [Linum grandiflorum]